MEGIAERRLACLCRHLTLQVEDNNDVVCPVALKGEIREEKKGNPVVIGGMVLDIHAIPSINPAPRTTIPGIVNYVLGGVGRNIAECMSKLGAKPFMISAIGMDMQGNLLLEHFNSSSLPIQGILRQPDIRTPIICNIFDIDGEVAAGVASVEAVEKFLTPEWIQQMNHAISSSPVLMVDANLSIPALVASCQVGAENNIPVWFEPVSVAKSIRISAIVKHVTLASPNEDELIAMANVLSGGDMFHSIERNGSKNISAEVLFEVLKPAILVLLEKGVKIVVLTVGVNGVFLCSREPSFMKIHLKQTKRYKFSAELHDTVASGCRSSILSWPTQAEGQSNIFAVHFPSLPASVVRLTGAGDCLVGGTMAALCSGLDLMQSVAVGIAAAKATVEADTNVPTAFKLTVIADDAIRIYSAAKILSH